jgi:hypothetical protein
MVISRIRERLLVKPPFRWEKLEQNLNKVKNKKEKQKLKI